MDCNKEEALRAKVISEKKMQSGDFIGARRIAQRAQQLFPDLENISQLLTVCDVHCSAQNKIYGTEMDWYGILKVEQAADDAIIKKQYRKLALLLHPDKNKFAGAEAAFKLIGEANRILSDQGKRSAYDMKYRVSLKHTAPKPPPHQLNRNSFVRKQYGVQNNFPNVANPHGISLNPHQQTQPGLSDGQQTFWTCCPFCSIRYQYYRDIMNRVLRCQTCQKSFIAYDLGAQSVPPGATWSQPAFSLHNEVPNQCPIKVKTQSPAMKPGSMGSQGSFNSKTAGPDLVKKKRCADEAIGGSKTNGKEDDNVDVGSKKGVRMPKSDADKPRKSGSSRRNTSRKRKNLPVESSESCQTSSSEDAKEAAIAQEKGAVPSGENSEFNIGHQPRRSSRKKQHVYYNESVSDDDDFVSPPKKARMDGSLGTGEERKDKPLDDGVPKTCNTAGFTSVVDVGKENIKQKENVPLEETVVKRKSEAGGCMINGKAAATADDNDERCKGSVNSEPNSCPDVTHEPVSLECLDCDFSDFDKDKREDCFSVDQIWAIYDPIDGMPRFYARIRKVFAPEFKLRFTWLEPSPDDASEIAWVKNELPYACGKFTYGQTEETADLPMFSHQVHGEKGGIRNSYFVYPRKGETWAIYKNWNTDWSSNPEIHRKYEFEYVEILSDFVPDAGIGVAYLGKVKGFVSLFRQSVQHGIVLFQIPPSELLRFSHRIPSFKMTGSEGEGVPKGSFELDPAALPNNLNDFSGNDDLKMEKESVNAGVNGSCTKSPENEMKSMNNPTMVKPMKHEENDTERETSELRRSPRELNGLYKKDGQVNQSECANQAEIGDKNHGDLTQSKGSIYVNLADERINTPKKHEKDDLETGNFKLRRSPRALNKKHSQVNASQFMVEEQTDRHIVHVKDDHHGSVAHPKGSISSCQYDEKIPLHVKGQSSNSFTKNAIVSASISSNKILEAQFYDFSGEKSEEKFQTGQLWALYSEVDRMPKNYAQVKKIEPTPSFRLHVVFLEACSPPKDMVQPVCCGTFKLKNGKTKVFPRADFSHQIRAESIGKNKFAILPIKGQVWALYKNWENNLMCSDIVNCKYDIVEVLEDNDHSTKVSVLLPLNGFKSVYKAPRRQRSSTGIMDIPRDELPRFSHQIPAVRHTGENDARLADCWELDPASVPGILVCLD